MSFAILSEITIPTGLTMLSTLGFGFALGLRHALEPDHLAAVSTIAGEGKSFWRALLTGCLWGAGHTLSLLIVGSLLILFRFVLAGGLEQPFELLVAATLIILGLNAFYRLYRDARQKELPTDENHHHRSRSLIVGMIHGLAGSGALTILISSTIQPESLAIFFLLVFGVGSIGGMALASVVLSIPLRLTLIKFTSMHLVLRGVAGLISISFGGWLIYEAIGS